MNISLCKLKLAKARHKQPSQLRINTITFLRWLGNCNNYRQKYSALSTSYGIHQTQCFDHMCSIVFTPIITLILWLWTTNLKSHAIPIEVSSHEWHSTGRHFIFLWWTAMINRWIIDFKTVSKLFQSVIVLSVIEFSHFRRQHMKQEEGITTNRNRVQKLYMS